MSMPSRSRCSPCWWPAGPSRLPRRPSLQARTPVPISFCMARTTPHGDLPDLACTPGATNPVVTPATISTTICKSGWTATVRPPSNYTSPLERAQIVRYRYADIDATHHEEDHLVPLEVGGAPRDPLNLWPEVLRQRAPERPGRERRPCCHLCREATPGHSPSWLSVRLDRLRTTARGVLQGHRRSSRTKTTMMMTTTNNPPPTYISYPSKT